MPKFEVTLNNGRVITVDAADEASAAAQAQAQDAPPAYGGGYGPNMKAGLEAVKSHPVGTGSLVGGLAAALALPTGGVSIPVAASAMGLGAAGGAGWGKVYDALFNDHVKPSMGEDIADLGAEGLKGAAGALIPPAMNFAGKKMAGHAAERAARPQMERVLDFFTGRRYNLFNPLTYAQALPKGVERGIGSGMQTVARWLGAEQPSTTPEPTKYRPGAGMSSEVPYRAGGSVTEPAPSGFPEVGYERGAGQVAEGSHFGEAGNLPELSRPDLLKEAKMRAAPVGPRLAPELPPLPPPPPSRIDALKAAQARTRPSMQGLQDMAPMPNPNAAHLAELDALGPSIKVQRPPRVVEPEPVSTFAPGRGIDADPLLPPAEMQPVYTPKPKPKPSRPTKPTSHTHTGPSWGDRMTKKK